MINNYENDPLVRLDKFCDYIPVVSTVTNLFDLFQKCIILPQMSEASIRASHYYTYLNYHKSYERCTVLLLPFIGNAIIHHYDSHPASPLQEKLLPRNSSNSSPKTNYSAADKELFEIADPKKSKPEAFQNFVGDNMMEFTREGIHHAITLLGENTSRISLLRKCLTDVETIKNSADARCVLFESGMTLEALALTYESPIVQQKFRALKQEIPIFGSEPAESINLNITEQARVAGDGNCYYRSLYIGAIENYISSPHRTALFEHLLKNLKAIVPSIEEKSSDAHTQLIKAVREAKEEKRWTSIQGFHRDIKTFDESFVRACRHWIAQWIFEYKDTEIYGLPLGKIIAHELRGRRHLVTEDEPSQEEIQSALPAYLDGVVRKMGQDAEGCFVDLGLLFGILNVQGGVVNVDRRETVPTTYVRSSFPGDPTTRVLAIRLGGHYNLLRSKRSS